MDLDSIHGSDEIIYVNSGNGGRYSAPQLIAEGGDPHLIVGLTPRQVYRRTLKRLFYFIKTVCYTIFTSVEGEITPELREERCKTSKTRRVCP